MWNLYGPHPGISQGIEPVGLGMEFPHWGISPIIGPEEEVLQKLKQKNVKFLTLSRRKFML